jgi:quercetin dioxygenase-like cupin family protein
MAIHRIAPGEPMDLAPYGDSLATARTHALFKTCGLEVFRLVLTAGKALPPHAVEGPMTFHCLEGSFDFDTPDRVCRVHRGQFLFLEGGVVHGVRAIEDASALVTVVLRAAQPSEAKQPGKAARS